MSQIGQKKGLRKGNTGMRIMLQIFAAHPKGISMPRMKVLFGEKYSASETFADSRICKLVKEGYVIALSREVCEHCGLSSQRYKITPFGREALL